MTRARSLLAFLSTLGAAVTAGGCTQGATVRHPPPGYFEAHAAPAYSPGGPAVASAPGSPCQPPPPVRPCEPPPCAAPPCAPPPSPCGLPCERGESDLHVRVLGGFPFMSGTDAGTGCNYWGADFGTTRCNCVGFDLFYRGEHCPDHKKSMSPGGGTTSRVVAAHFDRDGFGEDGGTIQFLGVKATYQKSIGGSMYGYVGAGPEYFWTQDYLDNDSGLGGFAEAGLGWRFASWGSLRLGVDLHGDYTSVTRKSASNSGDSRMLWTLAPNLGVEIDF